MSDSATVSGQRSERHGRTKFRPADLGARSLPQKKSSSAMASGSFCCPTSSCSRRSSLPTRCCQMPTAGGPTGSQLFNLKSAAIETGCLLLSSFTCGLASLAADAKKLLWTQLALFVTGILGAIFLGLEINEFHDMVMKGAGPSRSAFLSSFFTLVGCHGAPHHHRTALAWHHDGAVLG